MPRSTRPDIPDNITALIPAAQKAAFKKDVKAFFRHQGNLGRWGYSSPLYDGDPVNGAKLFQDWIANDNDYYVIKNEIDLIHRRARALAKNIGRENIDLLADLGCGTEEAVRNKIFPLLDEFNLAAYSPIDINEDYVHEAVKTALEKRDRSRIFPKVSDFMNDDITYDGRVMTAMLGGTITNFNGLTGVRDIFKRARIIAGDSGHFVFTHDGNENGDSILKAYNHILQQALTANVMFRIARDLKDNMHGDFDPESWRYVGIWDEGTRTISLCLTPTRDQEFWIDGEYFKVEKDEIFEENSIYKMAPDIVRPIAEINGWKIGGRYADRERKITMQHLIAA